MGACSGGIGGLCLGACSGGIGGSAQALVPGGYRGPAFYEVNCVCARVLPARPSVRLCVCVVVVGARVARARAHAHRYQIYVCVSASVAHSLLLPGCSLPATACPLLPSPATACSTHDGEGAAELERMFAEEVVRLSSPAAEGASFPALFSGALELGTVSRRRVWHEAHQVTTTLPQRGGGEGAGEGGRGGGGRS